MDILNLEQTWTQILDHVVPLGVRSIYQQHGKLCFLKGGIVYIQMSCPEIMNMARWKAADLERACQQVLHCPVSVQFDVEQPSYIAVID